MKKVLIVADEPGWVFERHALEIQKRLDEFHIDIAFRKMNIPDMSKRYDLVYVMDPMPLKHGYPPQEKTIMGLRCEFLYKEHPMGAKGLYWNGYPGRCVSIQDKCKALHVVNKNQMKEFKEVVTDKPLFLVQHGIDGGLFKGDCTRGYSSRRIKVGVVGRSSPNKGFDIVRQVCKTVDADFATAQYGQSKIPREKMPQFYSQLDVFVCMSKSEALNNGTMEAGAMGLPVVSTDCGAAREMIRNGENGFIIDRNAEELSRVLLKLKDGNIRRDMGQKMKEEIHSKWTWAKKIEDFRNMFERMI